MVWGREREGVCVCMGVCVCVCVRKERDREKENLKIGGFKNSLQTIFAMDTKKRIRYNNKD